MNPRRAFTNEWMIVLAIVAGHIAFWAPLVGRFTGWPHPICFGVLTLLAFLLTVFCGAVQGSDPRKAHRLAVVFMIAPPLVFGLLVLWAVGLVLWRKLF